MRDQRLSNVRSLLALLLASLLLLASAGKATYQTLRLIRNPSDGVLHPLDGLPCLVALNRFTLEDISS